MIEFCYSSGFDARIHRPALFTCGNDYCMRPYGIPNITQEKIRMYSCINAWLLPIFILLLVRTIVNIYIEYFAYYCGLTSIKVKSDFIIFCLYQWFHDRNIDPELTYRFPSQVQLPGSYRSIPADDKLFHVIPTTVIRSPDI